MQIETEDVAKIREAALSGHKWTAAELRKLPAAQRDAILAAAAALAEPDYIHDAELTAFEAFGEEDLYGDSTNTMTR